MSEYIKKIKTVSGEKQIDYEALANIPKINGVEVKDNITPSDINVYTTDEVDNSYDYLTFTGKTSYNCMNIEPVGDAIRWTISSLEAPPDISDTKSKIRLDLGNFQPQCGITLSTMTDPRTWSVPGSIYSTYGYEELSSKPYTFLNNSYNSHITSNNYGYGYYTLLSNISDYTDARSFINNCSAYGLRVNINGGDTSFILLRSASTGDYVYWLDSEMLINMQYTDTNCLLHITSANNLGESFNDPIQLPLDTEFVGVGSYGPPAETLEITELSCTVQGFYYEYFPEIFLSLEALSQKFTSTNLGGAFSFIAPEPEGDTNISLYYDKAGNKLTNLVNRMFEDNPEAVQNALLNLISTGTGDPDASTPGLFYFKYSED